jgi:hypothetical protein
MGADFGGPTAINHVPHQLLRELSAMALGDGGQVGGWLDQK